jgi:hypothetical protein
MVVAGELAIPAGSISRMVAITVIAVIRKGGIQVQLKPLQSKQQVSGPDGDDPFL